MGYIYIFIYSLIWKKRKRNKEKAMRWILGCTGWVVSDQSLRIEEWSFQFPVNETWASLFVLFTTHLYPQGGMNIE